MIIRFTFRISALSVLAVLAIWVPCFAQTIPDFETQVLEVFPDGTRVYAMVGDTNRDGTNELVVISSPHQIVRIARIASNGSVSIITEIPFSVSNPYSEYISLAIADVNGDNNDDILFYGRDNARKGSLFVLRQDATGTYSVHTYPTPELDAAYSMAVGDFDHDGDPDIATANHGHSASANVFIMYNDIGTFVRFDTLAAPALTRVDKIYAADFDQNGHTDVAVTTHPFETRAVRLYLNPLGSASIVVDIVSDDLTAASSKGLAVADMNGDDLLDIITTPSLPHNYTNKVQIFKRSGSAYALPQTFVAGNSPENPRSADFNGDGRADLVVDVAIDRAIGFFFGQGTIGNLNPALVTLSNADLNVDHCAAGNCETLSIGDVDNDTDIDVIFAFRRTVWIRNGPRHQLVTIDIKPGSFPNSINRTNKGTVPVAVLGAPTFDVSTINISTVRFADAPVSLRGRGLFMAAVEEDVNADGIRDLVLHFDTQALNLPADATTARLAGITSDGLPFSGNDSVRIVH